MPCRARPKTLVRVLQVSLSVAHQSSPARAHLAYLSAGDLAGKHSHADGEPPEPVEGSRVSNQAATGGTTMQITAETEAASPHIGFAGRAALLSAAMCPVLALYGFGVVLPPIAAAFARDPHAVLLSQIIGGIVALSFAVGSPPVGWLIDRFGYRAVLLVSTLAFSLIGTLGGLMNDLYAILATRVLLGFAVAGTLVASLAGIGSLNTRDRLRMYGFQNFVGGLIAIAIYPLVGWAASFGWRWPFAIHLSALLIIPWITALPKRPVPQARETGSARPTMRLAGLPISLLAVAVFVGMAGIIGSLFSPFLLVAIGITDPTKQSLPLIAMGMAALLASGSFGWVRAKLGKNGTFAAAIGMLGLGLIVAASTNSLMGITVGLALAALGMTAYTPNMSATAVAAARLNPGRALGLANGVLYGAQGLFPFVANGISAVAGPKAVFAYFGYAGVAIGIVYLIAAMTRANASIDGVTPHA
jgi:predicted MFS family arabinose efflux permease